MSNQNVEEFDVVVVGGGPGGSTLASLVALQGHRVLLLEKETFPRYQIGESLLPATIHGILRMTGAADEVAKAGFTHKRGGTFRWGASKDPWTFAFSVSPRMSGPTSFAYQVERSKFDKILLDNARRVGVDVREQCAVSAVIEDGDRVTGVAYTDASDSTRHAFAKWVVDASGNKSRIYTAVGGKRQYSDFFRSLALFGYFAGGKRMAEPLSGNIYCVAFESGWFWYIPLADDLTSVGAVVDRENASKIQGDPEAALTGLINECPEIKDMLDGVERVTTGQYGQIRVRKDYSYYNTEFWRPGMILVGDAACFVDPVFSSGVHLATYGALLAARSINSMLAGIVDEKAALREFESRYRHEYTVFYEFLTSFYELHEDENSYFWNAKKVINSSHTELEAFVDLVGGVSSGESALIDAEDAKNRFKEKSADFATAIGNLTSINSSSMVPLFKAGVVKQVMEESGQVQMRAILGDEAEPETPHAPDGLIASPDGMFWVDPRQVSAAQGMEASSGR
jgi:FAD-dependent halogenase